MKLKYRIGGVMVSVLTCTCTSRVRYIVS